MCQWAPEYSCAGGSSGERVLNGMSSRAVPCRAVPCHEEPCQAMLGQLHRAVPRHPGWGHARGSQAGITAWQRLTTRQRRPHSPPGTGQSLASRAGSVAVVPGSQGEARSLSALSGSSGNSQVSSFAGLCVKGSTVLIANTINRFVVLL